MDYAMDQETEEEGPEVEAIPEADLVAHAMIEPQRYDQELDGAQVHDAAQNVRVPREKNDDAD